MEKEDMTFFTNPRAFYITNLGISRMVVGQFQSQKEVIRITLYDTI